MQHLLAEPGALGDFWRSLDAGALTLLGDSVAASTKKAYKVAWDRWKQFLHRFFGIEHRPVMGDAQYLPYNWPLHIIRNMIHMFAWYLFTLRNLTADNVKKHLTALKYHFLQRRCNVAVFNWAELTALRSGLTRQPVIGEEVSSRRLPFTMEMVRDVFGMYHTDPRLSNRAYAVAVVLSFCCLLRPSEYLAGTATTTHVLKASALEFEMTLPSGQLPLVEADRAHMYT
jgi:hypothetical protein